jgi:prophage regulatory protein
MQTEATAQNADRFLRSDDIRARLNISDATLWRLIQRGDFPKPIKLGRMARWSESVVAAWMDARKNQPAA